MKLSEAWRLCRLVSREGRDTIPMSNRLSTVLDELAVFIDDVGDVTIIIDGSDDVEEWVSNFKFKSNRLGFHNEFYTSAVEIYRILNIPLNANITIIGHSRGGGIAQVLAYLINKPNISVVTFGSPKVANSKGIRLLSQIGYNHLRVRIKGDVVDNVPPVIFGYKHYQTRLITLNRVKGKFNHLAFGEAIAEYEL